MTVRRSAAEVTLRPVHDARGAAERRGTAPQQLPRRVHREPASNSKCQLLFPATMKLTMRDVSPTVLVMTARAFPNCQSLGVNNSQPISGESWSIKLQTTIRGRDRKNSGTKHLMDREFDAATMSIGFIGAGKMAQALTRGFLASSKPQETSKYRSLIYSQNSTSKLCFVRRHHVKRAYHRQCSDRAIHIRDQGLYVTEFRG